MKNFNALTQKNVQFSILFLYFHHQQTAEGGEIEAKALVNLKVSLTFSLQKNYSSCGEKKVTKLA